MDPEAVPRKLFFPLKNRRYCILDPIQNKKGKSVIVLADDVLALITREGTEVDDESLAHVTLLANTDESKLNAVYVGEGGLWINHHHHFKKYTPHILQDGDTLQLKTEGTVYRVRFLEPSEIILTNGQALGEDLFVESARKSARFEE